MDAADENVRPNDEVGGQPLADGRPIDDTDNPIRDGLYILTNKMSRTVLDLSKLLTLIYLLLLW